MEELKSDKSFKNSIEPITFENSKKNNKSIGKVCL